MKKKFFALPYLVWMVLFTVVPLILIFVYAVFTTTDTGEIIFTTQYLKQALSPENLSVLWRSLEYAVITTVICLILAYPAALILSRLKSKVGAIVNLLFVIPMWMNFLLRTYAWMTILEKNGLINRLLGHFGMGPFEMINTQGAVVLGMVYNYLPFMILPLYSVMTKIPDSVIEAAQDLGANTYKILTRVLIPMTVPGISTGIIMVFVPSVSTFIISRMLGGGGNLLIGDLIDLQFLGNAYNPNLGAAIALVLMVLILLCMSITNQFGDEEKGDLLK